MLRYQLSMVYGIQTVEFAVSKLWRLHLIFLSPIISRTQGTRVNGISDINEEHIEFYNA